MSLPWYMDSDLVRMQSSVAIKEISNRAALPVNHSRDFLALFPSSMKLEFLTGETLKQAATFISKFIEVKGEFPPSNFQVHGWVHSIATFWWAKMVCFVLEELEGPLL